jgi:hypothetical protein
LEEESTMKKSLLLSAAFAMVLGFGVAGAVAAGPETVVYEAKNGNVTFDHKAHGERLGDCAKCHEGTPAKIAIDKDAAHGAACKDCHASSTGPTKCGDCHKK